jgi:hypothetical protein
VLDRVEVREERCEQWQQGAVDEDDAVGGVVDDPGELAGGQPQVEGVQDSTHGRDGEVRLHVLAVVPHQCAQNTLLGHAELVAQGVGELRGAVADLAERAALRLAVACPGGDR